MRRLLLADRVRGYETATAVLADGGVVTAIGTRDELARSANEILGLEGSLMSGLTDHHIHPSALASTANSVDLGDANDFADIVQRFNASKAVMGTGLDEANLTEGTLPTIRDLAGVQRPVLLMRRCGHIAVANRQALALAGIDASTPEPPRGNIDRDTDGDPTGVVREAAVALLTNPLQSIVPPPDPEQLLATFRRLLNLGITRVHAIASTGSPLWCGSGREVDALISLAEDLPIDVDLIVATESVSDLREVASLLPSGRLRFGGWKGFADGSLGGYTAAISESYKGGDRGMLVLTDNASALAAAALDLGGCVAVHAIGDRAVDSVLDLFDQLGGGPSLRVEHASLMSDDAIARMADIGVTASVQPAFRVSDRELLAARLSPRLQEMAYRFADMDAAGIRLIGGSDAPVESPSPWETLAATRLSDPLSLYSRRLEIGDQADLVLLGESNVVQVWKDGVAQR